MTLGKPMPSLYNEPCDCSAGCCACYCEPDTDCVNRLSGDVRTMLCPKHKAYTWHHNGQCLKCQHGPRKAHAYNLAIPAFAIVVVLLPITVYALVWYYWG